MLCFGHFLFLMECNGSCRQQSRQGSQVKGAWLVDCKLSNREKLSVFLQIVFTNCTAARSECRVQRRSVCSLWYEESHYTNTIWGPRTGSGFLPAVCSSCSLSFQKIFVNVNCGFQLNGTFILCISCCFVCYKFFLYVWFLLTPIDLWLI